MKIEEKECKKVLSLGEFHKKKAYPADLDLLCKDCRTSESLKRRNRMVSEKNIIKRKK